MHKRHHHHHNHTVSGTFFVNGKGEAGINLCESGRPESISVYFTEDFDCHPCHPCNPHQDLLIWELEENEDHFRLEIEFDVSNIREISYRVIY